MLLLECMRDIHWTISGCVVDAFCCCLYNSKEWYRDYNTAIDADDDDFDESSPCDFVPHPYPVPHTEHLLLVSTGTCCTKRLVINSGG